MIKSLLPFILFLFLYLFQCQLLIAQEALFKVHFAGKANHELSEQVKTNLIELGLNNGFELLDWDKSSMSSPALYPEIVFAVEEGSLWEMSETEREAFSEYLVGGDGRVGGSLIVIRLDDDQSSETLTTVRKWSWLESLIYPEDPNYISTVAESDRPNLATVSISGKSGEKWIPGIKGAFARQLPHPMPKSELEGAKVFFTLLPEYKQPQFDALKIPSVIEDLCLKAIMWTAGYDDGSNLDVPYLALFAESNKQQVRLDWFTKSEINNDFFEIQRSTDGENWSPQMRLRAIGDQKEQSFYDFTDYDLVPGRYYYRVLQQDRDGNQTYSGLIAADIRIPDPLVYVFPNPVSEMLAIETSTSQESVLNYSIESISGQTVWQQNSEAKLAFHRIEVGVNQLTPGIYQLRVRSDKGERIQQFIKY